MSDLQALLLKLLLVLVTSPLWWPFLKAVWEELNESMEDEGGLFGRPPTRKEFRELERERELREDPLVHEAWPTTAERLAGRRQMGGGEARRRGTRGATAPKRRGANPAPRRPSGFR